MTRTFQSRRDMRIPLMFGFFAPPLAWTIHMLAVYPLIDLACWYGNEWGLIIVTAIALAVTLAAGVVSYRALHTTEDNSNEQELAWWERRQFLGIAGVSFSILFSMPILLWGFSALVMAPC